MKKTIIITLPLPPRQLSPNFRCHWATRAKATKTYRGISHLAALEYLATHPDNLGEPWDNAMIESVFFFKFKRRRDRDNCLAQLKAGFDGLADGGVVNDDSGFIHLPVRLEVDKSNPRLELHITQVC